MSSPSPSSPPSPPTTPWNKLVCPHPCSLCRKAVIHDLQLAMDMPCQRRYEDAVANGESDEDEWTECSHCLDTACSGQQDSHALRPCSHPECGFLLCTKTQCARVCGLCGQTVCCLKHATSIAGFRRDVCLTCAANVDQDDAETLHTVHREVRFLRERHRHTKDMVKTLKGRAGKDPWYLRGATRVRHDEFRRTLGDISAKLVAAKVKLDVTLQHFKTKYAASS